MHDSRRQRTFIVEEDEDYPVFLRPLAPPGDFTRFYHLFAFSSWRRVKFQGSSPRQPYFDTFLNQSRDLLDAPFARATLCQPARSGTLYGRGLPRLVSPFQQPPFAIYLSQP